MFEKVNPAHPDKIADRMRKLSKLLETISSRSAGSRSLQNGG